MKNVKTAWFCSSCGAQAPKWQGRCPACGEWNTMVEEKIVSEKKSKTLTPVSHGSRRTRPQLIHEIELDEEPRIKMPSAELNRVLGGDSLRAVLCCLEENRVLENQPLCCKTYCRFAHVGYSMCQERKVPVSLK